MKVLNFGWEPASLGKLEEPWRKISKYIVWEFKNLFIYLFIYTLFNVDNLQLLQ